MSPSIAIEKRTIVEVIEGSKSFGLKDGDVTKGSLITWQTADANANYQKWIKVENPDDIKKFNLMNFHSELLLLANWKDYFTNGEPTPVVHESVSDSMFN